MLLPFCWYHLEIKGTSPGQTTRCLWVVEGDLRHMGTKSFFLCRVYCGEVPTHLPGVSILAEKERASQASQLLVVGSSPQPFLSKSEDTGNLQLLEILRNVLSQPAAEFRGSVSPQKRQVLTPGGFKNTRKATQDRTFRGVADAAKHMSLLLNK